MKKLLFLGTFADKEYLPRLKPLVINKASVAVRLTAPLVWTELKVFCASRGITGIVSTCPTFLKLLVGMQGRKAPSIDNYAGSFFKKDGIEIIFINPLKHLVTVSYGKFLTERYLSKLLSPEKWFKTPEFNWTLIEPSNADSIYKILDGAYALACDIETLKDPLSIRCIGYTALYVTPSGELATYSYVLPIKDDWSLAWMRKINDTSVRKIFQNGKYDLSYLARFNAVPRNYLYDTAALLHCWYVELPKDLGFQQSFFVREASYWKDLADTQDLQEYYMYNAKDTWATALSWWVWMQESPEWAVTNYLQEFPIQFPAHLCEMTGIKRDENKRKEQEKHFEALIEKEKASLDVITKTDFNSNSHLQVKALMSVLGCKDIAKESSDEKSIKACQYRHPFNAHILEKILDIRGYRKLVSTYLKEGKELDGYILYTLNPHGTDSGRLASREHHFWCGLQIQNIPRGKDVKCTLVAPEGWRVGECDLEQAESRDTAHIAGDEKLIANVTGSKDFHSLNASAFFGIPYDAIYSDEKKKTLDKILRDLAKRVNHGANYLMGPDVLVDTMGLKNIYTAAAKLGLPKLWTPRQIATYLLNQFHTTYPYLSSVFYPAVVSEVTITNMLTSKAIHDVEYQATKAGWTRYCFGDPSKNKSHKNAYVAHVPQSLNAMTLNKAFMKVFYEIALHPEHRHNFRLLAQIHDSILFIFREGHEYLAEKVRECMEIPVTIQGYDGKVRTFTVPAALKMGANGMGAKNWGDTE